MRVFFILLVLVLSYVALGAFSAWAYGRVFAKGQGRYDGDERGNYALFGVLWPAMFPALVFMMAGERGERQQVAARERQQALEKEIREAMPEIERLLADTNVGTVLTGEVGAFVKNVRALSGVGTFSRR